MPSASASDRATRPTAHAEGVELVAVAVAVASRDVRTSALVDRSWTVAHAARVKFSNTWVDIVTDAIQIFIHKATSIAVVTWIRVDTIACIVCRQHTVIASFHIRTSGNFKLITNAIYIGVVDAFAVATVWQLRIHARGIIEICILIVVASPGIGASKIQARREVTAAIVERRLRVVVASDRCRTTVHIICVTNAIVIHVGCTRAAALAKGVKLVAFAVTIAFRDVETSAFVDLAQSVATAASVELSNTWVDVVADAVRVGIGLTRTAALSEGVQLVAAAVAVTFRDAVTPTNAALVKDGSWSQSHTPSGIPVHRPHEAARRQARCRRQSAFGLSWEAVTTTARRARQADVSVAVAVSGGDAVTATDAALVKDVSVTVAVSFRDVCASALVDLAWSVAHATGVELSNTWVDVVADSVGVGIGLTRPTTLAERVKLVSVAVTVPSRDAVTATDAALVKDVSVTVAVSFRDVCASTFVDLAWSVAHTASVELSNTWVNVVADAIGVRIGLTRPTALAERVELVAVTSRRSPARDAVTATDAALVKDVAVVSRSRLRGCQHIRTS